jgi:hypothetical protein
LLGLLALFGAHLGGGVQAAHALPSSAGVLGMQRTIGCAQPALQAGAGDAGGDGHDQCASSSAPAASQTAFMTCGLTASTITSAPAMAWRCRRRSMPCSAATARCSAPGSLARICGVQALGAQAADQAGGHVAGADKGNACCS